MSMSIALTSAILSCLKKLSVARWKSRLYVLITELRCRLRQHRWISVTRLLSYSRDSWFRSITARTASGPASRTAKAGTSSWRFRMMRRSMLFRHYLKVLEWLGWELLRSLVTSELAPISEASRLTLSSLDTTLSLPLK